MTTDVRKQQREASARYRAKSENTRKRKAYWDAYNARPEVKARRKAWSDRPENAESQRARQNRMYRDSLEFRQRRADYGRLHHTGMTREMFDAAIIRQENRCAICRREFDGKLRPHADHCHDTLKPRGLLCAPCNQAEGTIRSTGLTPLEYGQRLHDYLASHH